MARHALIPVLILGVAMTVLAGGDNAISGAETGQTHAAGGDSNGGRRLQSTTYNFATQLEMTVCLTEGHTTDSAGVSSEEFMTAVRSALNVSNPDYVKVDDTYSACKVDDWQRRVSIYNEADEASGKTAADIASEQVEFIYTSPGTTEFFISVAGYITADDPSDDTEGSDFDLESLGFLVIWLDSDGDVVSTQGSSPSPDVVNIGGTDVWWPWWAWLIYAGVVFCCICPMLFFFFKWRRNKEAEEDGFTGTGKDLGTPAAAGSATSINPYGGGYPAGEEYKNGQ